MTGSPIIDEFKERGWITFNPGIRPVLLENVRTAIDCFPKPYKANVPLEAQPDFGYFLNLDFAIKEHGQHFYHIAMVTFKNGFMNASFAGHYIGFVRTGIRMAGEIRYGEIEIKSKKNPNFLVRDKFKEADERFSLADQPSPEAASAALSLLRDPKHVERIYQSFSAVDSQFGYLEYLDVTKDGDAMAGTAFTVTDYMRDAVTHGNDNGLNHRDNMEKAVSIVFSLTEGEALLGRDLDSIEHLMQTAGQITIFDNHGEHGRLQPLHMFFGGEKGRQSVILTLYGENAERFIETELPKIMDRYGWQPTPLAERIHIPKSELISSEGLHL